MPQITALLNPITKDRVMTTLPAGKTLHDTIKLGDNLIIDYNGERYDGEILKENDLISIVVPPQGGDTGKDIARTGIVLAAQVAAAFATAKMSVFAQIAISAAVTAGASIGANAIIPPRGIE